jgi:hypothetical protein
MRIAASLSQAKGYRVGPVYEDVLAMAWVFLELITKSIALEAGRASSWPPSPAIVEEEALSAGVVLLNTDVFHCIRSLFDCLLVEVAEKAKTGPAQAKRLNACLAYFCHDLLTVIDPVQVCSWLLAFLLDRKLKLCSVLGQLSGQSFPLAVEEKLKEPAQAASAQGGQILPQL